MICINRGKFTVRNNAGLPIRTPKNAGYACDGSDLPSTQDFGTVLFSGPFESAQTVPDNTVQYTIIGKTLCGDDVRRITTRTYSSRNVPNQTKYSTYYRQDFDNQPPFYYINFILFTGYGADAQEAYGHTLAELLTLCPGTVVRDEASPWITPRGTTFSNPVAIGDSVYYASDSGFTQNYISYPAGTYRRGYYPQGTNVSNLTIYYLDVHEVWTFDIV